MSKEVEFSDDIFESMLNGTFENKPVNGEDEPKVDSDNDEHTQEDTDQEEELVEEEQLDEDDDGQLDEDSEDTEDAEEEDTLVEDYDSDDEDSDENIEGDEESEEELDEETEDEENSEDESEKSEDDEDDANTDDTNEESEDESETEDQNDGGDQDTDRVDYKAFYDAVVNTEFVVNGKKTKGFSDPKKIIQSQQMSGGFAEKMAGFKKYRPFMAPLKERGMLDDPAKFDLAMNLLDGDKEAIKKHLQQLDIDPLDLNMEDINYTRKPTIASNEALVLEDTLQVAKNAGIEDKVKEVVGKEWDEESFQEFLNNSAVRSDLLDHISSGAYDEVQTKIDEMKRLDINGTFGALSSINQYRAAVRQLSAENANTGMPNTQQVNTPVENSTTAVKKVKKKTVSSEKAKILKARKEEEYKQKAAKREAELNKQRKKAASASRKKVKAKPKPKFDPMKVEGQELDELMKFLIEGGR